MVWIVDPGRNVLVKALGHDAGAIFEGWRLALVASHVVPAVCPNSLSPFWLKLW